MNLHSGCLMLLLGCAATCTAQTLVMDGHTGGLLGAWADGKWIDSPSAAKLAKHGSKYRIVTLSGPATSAAAGDAKAITGECGDAWEVALPDLPKDAIAVSGAQSVFKTPTSLTANDRARSSFRSLLEHHGIRSAIKIDQLWQADIDGDGKPETLASFYNAADREATANLPGDYSLIAVRFLDENDKQRTLAPVIERYARGGEDISRLRLGPLVDINGDGKIEIIVRGQYSKGKLTHVYEYSGGKLNRVLECTCGH